MTTTGSRTTQSKKARRAELPHCLGDLSKHNSAPGITAAKDHTVHTSSTLPPQPARPPGRRGASPPLPFHLTHDRHRQPTAQKQHATRHREQSWFNRVRIKLISEQKSQNDRRGQVCQLSFTASFYTPAARFTLDRYGTGKMCAGIEITRFNVHREQNTNQTRYDLHVVHKVPSELVQLEQLVI